MKDDIPRDRLRPGFWNQPLSKLTPREWEALCDGCGKCCLNKLEDWDTGEIAWTNIGCTLLDGESCRCRDYPNRQATVPDCLQLTPEMVAELAWLPPTCGYRLVRDGHDLYWWHPLVSGDAETVQGTSNVPVLRCASQADRSVTSSATMPVW